MRYVHIGANDNDSVEFLRDSLEQLGYREIDRSIYHLMSASGGPPGIIFHNEQLDTQVWIALPLIYGNWGTVITTDPPIYYAGDSVVSGASLGKWQLGIIVGS